MAEGTPSCAALDRPPRPRPDRRRARARTADRDAHPQARTPAARPARRRTARRRATRPLLVPQGTDQLRGGLRQARRRSTDPRLLRANNPLPARPNRRPQTQPRTTHDRRHTQNAHTRRRSPTSTDAPKKARAAAKPPAASSATSPATSTDSWSTRRRHRLDRHRSIARPSDGTRLTNPAGVKAWVLSDRRRDLVAGRM